MHTFGGKFRIAPQISNLIQSLRNDRDYLEPFCGGLWVTQKITEGKRQASDISQPLITLYQAMQQGWLPPDSFSEDEYNAIKLIKNPSDPLTAFAGYGCSFSGKYFGGYARSGPRNYALNAKNSLLKKMFYCMDVEFLCKDYQQWNPSNCMIYCDPPYAGTTNYAGTGRWNPGEFWEVMRQWSQPERNNVVLISEYSAPQDFETVLEIVTKTDIHTNSGKEKRIERVFRCKN